MRFNTNIPEQNFRFNFFQPELSSDFIIKFMYLLSSLLSLSTFRFGVLVVTLYG
jgi:hypothetical protein